MALTGLSTEEVNAFCRAHWSTVPDAIEFPGGQGRKTVVVQMGPRRFAISRRKTEGRARLEAMVLEQLSATGRVPQPVFCDGRFVVQQYVQGQRLTEALELASAPERRKLLSEAADALVTMQAVATENALDQSVPEIGARPNWFLDFSFSSKRLSDQLNVSIEAYPVEDVARLISRKDASFCKWDARPGNAVMADGKSVWFDWEHCGRGSVEDDLVWLFSDEWTPIAPFPDFARVLGVKHDRVAGIEARFIAKSILHICIRLSLIFQRKGTGPWWSAQEAMRHDRVGVTPAHVRRLCQKGGRLCEGQRQWEPVASLFRQIEALVS